MTGNIDLSMGSVVGLCTTATCLLIVNHGWHPAAAVLAVLAMGAVIGLVNGLLVTYLRVQAFVVTLCGMFVYRSLGRWIANDQNTGLGAALGDWSSFFASSDYGVSVYLIILLALLAVATVMLHLSVVGRYFYAIGLERAGGEILRHRDRRLQDPRVRSLFDAHRVLLDPACLQVSGDPAVGGGVDVRAHGDCGSRARRPQPARRRRDGARECCSARASSCCCRT